MSVREAMFAAMLAAASVLVVAGVAGWSGPAALIVAGLLLAGWSWLMLGDTPGPPTPPDWRASVDEADS